jgi:hypothetical protein
MRPTSKFAALACALMLVGLSALGDLGRVGAQESSKSARGGALARTARHQFEVFFYATGLRVFPLDPSGAPLDASRMTGTATFYHPNSPKPWFARPLSPSAASPGQAPPSLDLVLDLSSVPATGAKVAFEIGVLPAEPTAAFTVPFEFVKTSGSTASNPSPPPAATAAPRYVYGPGYYGYGYYTYPGPAAAPAAEGGQAVYGYSAPAAQQFSRSYPSRDPGTGRNYPAGGLISKPWLRPAD